MRRTVWTLLVSGALLLPVGTTALAQEAPVAEGGEPNAVVPAVAYDPSPPQKPRYELPDFTQPPTLPTTDDFGDPAFFDIFVDGSRYSGIVGVGGTGNVLYRNVVVEIIPEPTLVTGTLNETHLAAGVRITITPLLGGIHTVGVGYHGWNLGIQMSGLPSQTVTVYVAWLNFNVFTYALSGPQPCSGWGFVHIADLGVSNVNQFLGSRGSSLDANADAFIALDVSYHLGAFIGNGRHVYFDTCPGKFLLYTEDLGDTNGISYKVGTYSGRVTTVPSSLYIERFFLPEWSDGYLLIAGGRLSGTFNGAFSIAGVPVTAQATFSGVQRATVMWKGGCCLYWARVGLGLENTGDWATARLTASGFPTISTTATRQSNGNVHYDNRPFAIDNDVPVGSCYSAFYAAAWECNLGDSYT